MYDPVETDISKEQLNKLISESRKKGCSVALIGGWATYFFVTNTYRSAFGRNYMESRDIDLFIDPDHGPQFAKLIEELGFRADGMYFRWELIYEREKKRFLNTEEAKAAQMFNLIYIFLDLFSSKDIPVPKTWCDLPPLMNFNIKTEIELIDGLPVVKMDVLIGLKCVALFARDKADKENKDACDLYALLNYSGRAYGLTELLKKAVEKILGRNDLQHTIAEQVLLD